ncbi:MAG: AAA family ATPase [Thermodesulfobacteriota bacterium]|nr:AAA family ATPase [Thermodesulfobacteriota bacterium]
MYNQFYGFREKPFEITPDPRFLYLSESHKEALAHLTYAVREKKGFTVITGEVGTGKTTLVQTVLSRLDGNTKTAYIFNPKLGSTDFLHYVCEDLGLKGQKRSKGQYISQLHHFLLACYSRNENVVLIIDEAQALDPNLLEEVRLLTNLETSKCKLLQVILMGQPELNEILSRPQFRQLKQRVSLRYHLQTLNKEETKNYIKKRLRMAGAADPNFFTPKALNEIYRYSKGIPRLINIVCDNALLTGYATDQKVIGDRIIHEVIHNLEGIGLPKNRRRIRNLLLWGIFAGLCLLGFFFLWKFGFFLSEHLDISRWLQAIKKGVEKIYQILPLPLH